MLPFILTEVSIAFWFRLLVDCGWIASVGFRHLATWIVDRRLEILAAFETIGTKRDSESSLGSASLSFEKDARLFLSGTIGALNVFGIVGLVFLLVNDFHNVDLSSSIVDSALSELAEIRRNSEFAWLP